MFFVNRYLKYYYDSMENWFTPVTFDYLPHVSNLINTYKIRGYNNEEIESLRNCFGLGAMIIPTPNCLILFVREIIQPFFIFIIYSIILWYY